MKQSLMLVLAGCLATTTGCGGASANRSTVPEPCSGNYIVTIHNASQITWDAYLYSRKVPSGRNIGVARPGDTELSLAPLADDDSRPRIELRSNPIQNPDKNSPDYNKVALYPQPNETSQNWKCVPR